MSQLFEEPLPLGAELLHVLRVHVGRVPEKYPSVAHENEVVLSVYPGTQETSQVSPVVFPSQVCFKSASMKLHLHTFASKIGKVPVKAPLVPQVNAPGLPTIV